MNAGVGKRNIERIGFAWLVILAALLPFELKSPIVSLGPLVITNVEFVLYLVLAIWVVSRIISRRIHWTLAHSGVLIWIAALIVTAIIAPIEREAALKFALRSVGGGLLFFAAADWITTPQRTAWIISALIAGTLVSALAGSAEVWLPNSAAIWSAFKTNPSLIGGYVRASGTFQYANTAAMYWEAMLPIVLMFGVWLTLRRPRGHGLRAVSALAAVVVMQAIMLTASRAALIVTVLTLITLIAIGPRGRSPWRTPAAISLTALIVLIAGQLIFSPWFALRLRSDNDADWFKAAYEPARTTLTLEAGQSITLNITVRNTSIRPWPATGDQPVALSYHWIDPVKNQVIVFDGVRNHLPYDLAPGDSLTLAAQVLAPDQPGQYALQWDMLQEGVTWFSTRGQPVTEVATQVKPATHAQSINIVHPVIPPMLPPQPSRINLWRAGVRMWLERPIGGSGPDNFRHHYGTYLGLEPFDDRINANSLYIETLADMGLIGVAALGVLIVMLGVTVRHAWRRTRDSFAHVLIVGLTIALAAFFAHGVVDYFFEFTPTYGLWWLLMGMMAGLSSSWRGTQHEDTSSGVNRV